jgi:hypothetical protein
MNRSVELDTANLHDRLDMIAGRVRLISLDVSASSLAML